MTYMFQLNPLNGKMRIYVDIASSPDQQIISNQVQEFLIPLLDTLLQGKDKQSKDKDFYAREFKIILEAMIDNGLINDHHFNIWYLGKKV